MAVEWVVAAGVLAGASAALWGLSAWMTRRIEATVPINGRFVEVDGERFHYVEEGKGPPLVMIHGLMGSSRNLTYALSGQLREHFRVISLDRPGSGYSTRHSGTPADLPAQARQIAAFINTLDLGKPLVLGHSLGGAIALALALALDEKTLAPVSASVSYYPDSKDLFNNFKTGKKAPATVRIEKIERVGDKVFAVSGSFSAADLEPGVMSKKLQGQTLPAVSGRFAFTEVPVLDK